MLRLGQNEAGDTQDFAIVLAACPWVLDRDTSLFIRQFSSTSRTAFVTDQRPTNCYLSDWYVFPENFAWTMAFTHEDGWLGPYFARHERFSELNRENEMKIRKAREAEVARLKGWR